MNTTFAEGSAAESLDCWKTIGIFGDHTCERLVAEIHCRNCEIYRAEGRHLLDRPLPEGYREELTRQLAEPVSLGKGKPIGLVLFRIGGAWLALPSGCFSRTLPILPVTPIPGRKNDVFEGVVSAHGGLRLCVSLAPLLGDAVERAVVDASARVFPRMLEIFINGEAWVFRVDEVLGSIECLPERIDMGSMPQKDPELALVRGLFDWQGLRVMLLGEERLLHEFRISLS